MKNAVPSRVLQCGLVFALTALIAGCATSAKSRYFGKTEPPSDNVLRYVSGSEPETLDPQLTTAQTDARIVGGLFEGFVEYDPKTMQPIPAIAERWEQSEKLDEFIFYLRKNARWSDGTPITAKDFVYSFRRALAPETASRSASFGYYIKYAEAYNSNDAFLKKNGEFLLAKDFAAGSTSQAAAPAESPKSFGIETEFHKFLHSPERLTIHTDAKAQAKQIEANPKLKAALDGAELVPVRGEDIGIEAIDDYTVRVTLNQSAPFMMGLLAHQFFRLVPQKTIEKHGKNWTKPENIVTCGPFKVKEFSPYHQLIVVKDNNYWDAATVKLDAIEFYPIEDFTTMMNLYKSGSLYATYNHTVPASWVDEVRAYKDEYLDHPEVAIEYYSINIKKPPMDNVKVRRAFSLAIDRTALAAFRKTTKPLYDFTPEGIFPEYEIARQKVSEEMRQKAGATSEEWEKRNKFNPEKACQLFNEAGYKASFAGASCRVENFPVEQVSVTYNTAESNRQIAEFIQAQWRQNLGLTVPIKNMEWKVFIPIRNRVEFDGFARNGWVGDYMDPFTFLDLHRTPVNQGATGYYDPKYDEMLDNANRELEPAKRYEMLARAEFYMMEQQPVISLQTQATNWIKKPFVKGLYPNPGTLHAWKYVYIERDPAKWDTNVDDILKQ